MSSRSRNLRRSRPARGENLAPALFPFLAVLVCTMGALVLILVLVVSQASASANRPTPVDETLQEAADQVHLVSEEMIAQRDRQQKEIERRRQDLAAIEDHIAKLTDELEHYREMAKAIGNRKNQTESQRNEQKRKSEELEAKLKSEQDRLEDLKEKAKGNVPAFAIFPYQGTNGTTRRPIYLECIEEGLIIQPEGTLLSLDDLKPPYGPGNPLDTSLRLIRTEFQKLDPNASIGVSPYPLLLVRPNGIKSYVLARAAMAGWDDQFGYELIAQEMPLAFPPTLPGLNQKLEGNLVVARERQIALAAAMPRRYAGPQPWEEDLNELDAATNGGGFGSEGGSSAGGGGAGFGEDWTAIDSTFVAAPAQPLGGSRGSAMSNGGTSNQPPTSNTANNNNSLQQPRQNSPQSQSPAQPPTQPPPSSLYVNNTPGVAQPLVYRNDNTILRQTPGYANATQNANNDVMNGAGFAGGPPSSNGLDNTAGNEMPNSTFGGNGQPSQNSLQSNNGSTGTATNGSSSANSNNSSSQSLAGGSSNSLSQGSAMEPASPGQDPTQSYSGMTAREKAAMNGATNPDGSFELSSQSSSSKNTPTDSTQPSVTVSPRRSKQSESSGSPIAHTWSSRRYGTNSTAVSRPMNLVVMEDRWLVMRDEDPTKIETTITLENGPMVARNELFQTISKRVDSWGVAVSNGYWKPKLTIEVTPQAELSSQRLQKLLEGSELEADFIPLRTSKR